MNEMGSANIFYLRYKKEINQKFDIKAFPDEITIKTAIILTKCLHDSDHQNIKA